MEALPFLITVAVFAAIGLAIKIAALRHLKQLGQEQDSSRR